MYYYLHPDIQCKIFIKNLINKNENSISNIQSNIRNNQNVNSQVIQSIDFNLKEIEKNPCVSTFNKYNVNDFFSFYHTVLNHHKEQYLESDKCRNRTYDILAFIDSFNSQLKKTTTKLNK